MQLEDINTLKAADYNPQKMSKRKYEELLMSLKTWGQVRPVIVNKDGTIIAGHSLVRACGELGMTEVWVERRDYKKEDEMIQNVALNRIRGANDIAQLLSLLEEMDDTLRKLTGFSEKDMEDLSKKLQDKLDENTVNQSLEVYQSGKIKQIVLYYSFEEFNQRMAWINELMEKYELKNPSDLFKKLLNEYD